MRGITLVAVLCVITPGHLAEGLYKQASAYREDWTNDSLLFEDNLDPNFESQKLDFAGKNEPDPVNYDYYDDYPSPDYDVDRHGYDAMSRDYYGDRNNEPDYFGQGNDFESKRTQDEFQVYGLEHSIPGSAGIDYPNFVATPKTNFRCDDFGAPGLYGDVQAKCQVFHICQEDGRHDSFLCPVGTIFNQQHFVCDWWYNFNCSDTQRFVPLNSFMFTRDDGARDGRRRQRIDNSVREDLNRKLQAMMMMRGMDKVNLFAGLQNLRRKYEDDENARPPQENIVPREEDHVDTAEWEPRRKFRRVKVRKLRLNTPNAISFQSNSDPGEPLPFSLNRRQYLEDSVPYDRDAVSANRSTSREDIYTPAGVSPDSMSSSTTNVEYATATSLEANHTHPMSSSPIPENDLTTTPLTREPLNSGVFFDDNVDDVHIAGTFSPDRVVSVTHSNDVSTFSPIHRQGDGPKATVIDDSDEYPKALTRPADVTSTPSTGLVDGSGGRRGGFGRRKQRPRRKKILGFKRVSTGKDTGRNRFKWRRLRFKPSQNRTKPVANDMEEAMRVTMGNMTAIYKVKRLRKKNPEERNKVQWIFLPRNSTSRRIPWAEFIQMRRQLANAVNQQSTSVSDNDTVPFLVVPMGREVSGNRTSGNVRIGMIAISVAEEGVNLDNPNVFDEETTTFTEGLSTLAEQTATEPTTEPSDSSVPSNKTEENVDCNPECTNSTQLPTPDSLGNVSQDGLPRTRGKATVLTFKKPIEAIQPMVFDGISLIQGYDGSLLNDTSCDSVTGPAGTTLPRGWSIIIDKGVVTKENTIKRNCKPRKSVDERKSSRVVPYRDVRRLLRRMQVTDPSQRDDAFVAALEEDLKKNALPLDPVRTGSILMPKRNHRHENTVLSDGSKNRRRMHMVHRLMMSLKAKPVFERRPSSDPYSSNNYDDSGPISVHRRRFFPMVWSSKPPAGDLVWASTTRRLLLSSKTADALKEPAAARNGPFGSSIREAPEGTYPQDEIGNQPEGLTSHFDSGVVEDDSGSEPPTGFWTSHVASLPVHSSQDPATPPNFDRSSEPSSELSLRDLESTSSSSEEYETTGFSSASSQNSRSFNNDQTNSDGKMTVLLHRTDTAYGTEPRYNTFWANMNESDNAGAPNDGKDSFPHRLTDDDHNVPRRNEHEPDDERNKHRNENVTGAQTKQLSREVQSSARRQLPTMSERQQNVQNKKVTEDSFPGKDYLQFQARGNMKSSLILNFFEMGPGNKDSRTSATNAEGSEYHSDPGDFAKDHARGSYSMKDLQSRVLQDNHSSDLAKSTLESSSVNYKADKNLSVRQHGQHQKTDNSKTPMPSESVRDTKSRTDGLENMESPENGTMDVATYSELWDSSFERDSSNEARDSGKLNVHAVDSTNDDSEMRVQGRDVNDSEHWSPPRPNSFTPEPAPKWEPHSEASGWPWEIRIPDGGLQLSTIATKALRYMVPSGNAAGSESGSGPPKKSRMSTQVPKNVKGDDAASTGDQKDKRTTMSRDSSSKTNPPQVWNSKGFPTKGSDNGWRPVNQKGSQNGGMNAVKPTKTSKKPASNGGQKGQSSSSGASWPPRDRSSKAPKSETKELREYWPPESSTKGNDAWGFDNTFKGSTKTQSAGSESVKPWNSKGQSGGSNNDWPQTPATESKKREDTSKGWGSTNGDSGRDSTDGEPSGFKKFKQEWVESLKSGASSSKGKDSWPSRGGGSNGDTGRWPKRPDSKAKRPSVDSGKKGWSWKDLPESVRNVNQEKVDQSVEDEISWSDAKGFGGQPSGARNSKGTDEGGRADWRNGQRNAQKGWPGSDRGKARGDGGTKQSKGSGTRGTENRWPSLQKGQQTSSNSRDNKPGWPPVSNVKGSPSTRTKGEWPANSSDQMDKDSPMEDRSKTAWNTKGRSPMGKGTDGSFPRQTSKGTTGSSGRPAKGWDAIPQTKTSWDEDSDELEPKNGDEEEEEEIQWSVRIDENGKPGSGWVPVTPLPRQQKDRGPNAADDKQSPVPLGSKGTRFEDDGRQSWNSWEKARRRAAVSRNTETLLVAQASEHKEVPLKDIQHRSSNPSLYDVLLESDESSNRQWSVPFDGTGVPASGWIPISPSKAVPKKFVRHHNASSTASTKYRTNNASADHVPKLITDDNESFSVSASLQVARDIDEPTFPVDQENKNSGSLADAHNELSSNESNATSRALADGITREDSSEADGVRRFDMSEVTELRTKDNATLRVLPFSTIQKQLERSAGGPQHRGQRERHEGKSGRAVDDDRQRHDKNPAVSEVDSGKADDSRSGTETKNLQTSESLRTIVTAIDAERDLRTFVAQRQENGSGANPAFSQPADEKKETARTAQKKADIFSSVDGRVMLSTLDNVRSRYESSSQWVPLSNVSNRRTSLSNANSSGGARRSITRYLSSVR